MLVIEQVHCRVSIESGNNNIDGNGRGNANGNGNGNSISSGKRQLLK